MHTSWLQGLSALITGVVASVGVLFPAFGFLGILGLVAFLVLLHSLECSRRAILLSTLTFGFAYCGGVHIWLWNLLPLDWLGVTNPLYGYLLLLFYWSTIAFSFGTVFLLFTIPYVRYRNTSPFSGAFFTASLWTVVQYVQMWGTSLVTAGDGSLFGAHYSTVLLGYAATSIPSLLFLARFGGIFVMTFVCVYIAALLASTVEQWLREKRVGSAMYMAVISLTLIGIGSLAVPSHTPDKPTIPVALVTTDFTTRGTFTRDTATEKVQSQISETLPTAPHGTLYILPEEITILGTDSNHAFLSALDLGDHSALFSSAVHVGEKKRLQMSLYHSGTSTGFYDKMLLSPQGEYGPWFYQVWLRIIGGTKLVEASRSNYTYERGVHTAVAHIPGATIGALFCSDILSPQLYRFLARDGATVLTESTSLAWFHSSPIVDSVMLTIARVRAAENNRYLLVAGNAAPSTVISNTGTVIERTAMNSFSVLQTQVPVITGQSLYTRLGNFVLLPYLAVILLTVFSYIRKDWRSLRLRMAHFTKRFWKLFAN